jgi:tellurite resistance protein
MFVSAELEARLRPMVEKFAADTISDLVDLLVLVANADGVIDPKERAALQTGMEIIAGATLIKPVVNALVQKSLEKIAKESVGERALVVGQALARANHAEDGLRVGVAVALASEGVAQAEHEVLAAISRAAGVSAARLDELIAEEQLALKPPG